MGQDAIFLENCFNSYNKLRTSVSTRKDYHDLILISKNMINLYLESAENVDYSSIIEKFKKIYITDESRIESNESKEEKEGIGAIYDYICDYDFSKKNFNIFVDSMQIHVLLYSKMPGKEFGGKIRTEQALLVDTDIEVMTAEDAKKHYNSYIMNSYKIMSSLDEKNILDYIKGSLMVMVDLIKTQPFADGNKRTFRSLFNLMLKRRNLPPVYVGGKEVSNFSKALLKAMREDDYMDLYELYLRLIADSISKIGLKEIQRIKKNVK